MAPRFRRYIAVPMSTPWRHSHLRQRCQSLRCPSVNPSAATPRRTGKRLCHRSIRAPFSLTFISGVDGQTSPVKYRPLGVFPVAFFRINCTQFTFATNTAPTSEGRFRLRTRPSGRPSAELLGHTVPIALVTGPTDAQAQIVKTSCKRHKFSLSQPPRWGGTSHEVRNGYNSEVPDCVVVRDPACYPDYGAAGNHFNLRSGGCADKALSWQSQANERHG